LTDIIIQTVRSDLEKNRAISLSCDQRCTISLSSSFSTTFCSVNARPGRAITLLRGNRRALTKCDLTVYSTGQLELLCYLTIREFIESRNFILISNSSFRNVPNSDAIAGPSLLCVFLYAKLRTSKFCSRQKARHMTFPIAVRTVHFHKHCTENTTNRRTRCPQLIVEKKARQVGCKTRNLNY
jgi:hypothetical protein